MYLFLGPMRTFCATTGLSACNSSGSLNVFRIKGLRFLTKGMNRLIDTSMIKDQEGRLLLLAATTYLTPRTLTASLFNCNLNPINPMPNQDQRFYKVLETDSGLRATERKYIQTPRKHGYFPKSGSPEYTSKQTVILLNYRNPQQKVPRYPCSAKIRCN